MDEAKDLPSPSRRILDMARRISNMPPELMEPIIELLPLHRLLQLSCQPTTSPVLRRAIVSSRAWAWLLRESEQGYTDARLVRLQRLWVSWNRLTWLWYRQPVRAIELPWELRGVFESLNVSAAAGAFPVAKPMYRDVRPAGYTIYDHGESLIAKLESHIIYLFKDIVGKTSHYTGFTRNLLTATCTYLPSGSAGDHPTEVDDIINKSWTCNEVCEFLPPLAGAFESLNRAKYEELLRLATLYETFPDLLKTPVSPQSPTNHKHILARLQHDTRRIVKQGITRPGRIYHKEGRYKLEWYRFRYPHPALVPFDWCLTLFQTLVQKKGLGDGSFPKEIREDIDRAMEGFEYIYNDNGQPGTLRRVDGGNDGRATHCSYRLHDARCSASPSPEAELKWLKSFCKCVEWMRTDHPDHAAHCKEITSFQRKGPSPLLEPADYSRFVEVEEPSIVAEQLRADMSACEATSGKLPSLLALYMPASKSSIGMQIASYLVPDAGAHIQRIVYEDMINKIKVGLQREATSPIAEQDAEDRHKLVSDFIPDDVNANENAAAGTGTDTKDSPFSKWQDSVKQYINAMPPKKEAKKCYICRYRIETQHSIFPSMCEACGEFNLAGRSLSQPENLDMHGKTALVTGGRINLGYHTALRLLRCGARVIVSTRYPQDAAMQYGLESDFNTWKDNLNIIGADFRSASDAFALVAQVRHILEKWDCQLDVLVNNAAQTLTDSTEKEGRAVGRENVLWAAADEKHSVVVKHEYVARVRGGNPPGAITGADKAVLIETAEGKSGVDQATQTLIQQTNNLEITKRPEASSWVQSLTEIPYEDVITAHSINTFVPLILIRELLPLMTQPSPNTGAGTAVAYIVNVSSREGIFENTPRGAAKNGKHVHTNMSKAGLNMITETEAATAWAKHRVAMNTVDPGYMSAAPEMENVYDGERPIGWEDGAGRVLWPIAIGEMAKKQQSTSPEEVGGGKLKETRQVRPVWGRFLKHYGAMRVDVRFGRG